MPNAALAVVHSDAGFRVGLKGPHAPRPPMVPPIGALPPNNIFFVFSETSRTAILLTKGPFIATQRNSTQLDVELSCVAINGF